MLSDAGPYDPSTVIGNPRRAICACQVRTSLPDMTGGWWRLRPGNGGGPDTGPQKLSAVIDTSMFLPPYGGGSVP